MEEQDITRAKILGVLIQDARSHAGRSIEDCATVLNVSPEEFRKAESGEYVVSLPQLEVLAIYLNVPMAHFWGTHTLEESEKQQFSDLLALRHKIIGGLLRQARLEAGRSVEDLAEQIGVSTGQIGLFRGGHAWPSGKARSAAADATAPGGATPERPRVCDRAGEYALSGDGDAPQ